MPHSPIMSKIRCHSPNKKSSRVCNRNYLVYIGSREGVDLTKIDYLDDLTKIENLTDQKTTEESANNIYIKYISERPTSNGLFGNFDVSDLTKVSNDIADITASGKNVYRAIVSLSEKDAIDLGYDTKEKWVNYMKSVIPDVAKEFKIPIDKLKWTAAVHMEKGHPHCHYMFWSTENKIKSPFIHISVQNKCREFLSKEMFREEREIEIVNKTMIRDLLIDKNKNIAENLKENLKNNYIPGSAIHKIPGKFKNETLNKTAVEMANLISILPLKGKITYAYVSPEVKEQVQKIVNLIETQQDMKKEFLKYYESIDKISETYSTTPEKKILNRTKAEEDIKKRIGNIILREAKSIRCDLKKEDKINQDQLVTEMKQNQAILNGCYTAFTKSFDFLLNQNHKQEAYYADKQFASQSKEARKIQAKQSGKKTEKKERDL